MVGVHRISHELFQLQIDKIIYHAMEMMRACMTVSCLRRYRHAICHFAGASTCQLVVAPVPTRWPGLHDICHADVTDFTFVRKERSHLRTTTYHPSRLEKRSTQKAGTM